MPRHRALVAGGKVDGSSALGRLEAKARMLALEEVETAVAAPALRPQHNNRSVFERGCRAAAKRLEASP